MLSHLQSQPAQLSEEKIPTSNASAEGTNKIIYDLFRSQGYPPKGSPGSGHSRRNKWVSAERILIFPWNSTFGPFCPIVRCFFYFQFSHLFKASFHVNTIFSVVWRLRRPVCGAKRAFFSWCCKTRIRTGIKVKVRYVPEYLVCLWKCEWLPFGCLIPGASFRVMTVDGHKGSITVRKLITGIYQCLYFI